MLFFAHFHVISSPLPDFAPNFEGPNAGQYGVREWYQFHVFYPTGTRGSPSKVMTYESECEIFCFLLASVLMFAKIIGSVSTTSTRLWVSLSQRSPMPHVRIQLLQHGGTGHRWMAPRLSEVGVTLALFAHAMIVRYLLMLCLVRPHSTPKSQRHMVFLVTHSVSDALTLLSPFPSHF
jgi:hypothetical protein